MVFRDFLDFRVLEVRTVCLRYFSRGYVKGWLKYLFNHANDAVNGTGMTTGELKHIAFRIRVEAEWAAWVGR